MSLARVRSRFPPAADGPASMYISVYYTHVYILIGLLVVVLVPAVLRFRARQKNAQRLAIRSPNGTDESAFVPIGGIEQWVAIRGDDRANPVLLFVHGGPGVSYVPFSGTFCEWERHFTVVHWDQRGAGKTFGRNGKGGSGDLTIEQIASDGVEVAEFLCRHLGQPRVILFCHSWGTIVGLSMIKRRPDLFRAYVGSGQIADMSAGEQISYDLVLEQARRGGKSKAFQSLETLGRPPYPSIKQWMVKQRAIIMTAPPLSEGRSMPDIFTTPLTHHQYSLKDALAWYRSFGFSIERLYGEMMGYNALKLGSRFEVPILILQGEDDIQAPTICAQEWFDEIEAPSKEFVTLAGEGHAAVLSHPDLFLREMMARLPADTGQQWSRRQP
jgi:pimeloyl-ACP methyl ester carboxylesterase